METVFGAFYPSDDLGDRKLPDNTVYLAENGIFRRDKPEAIALGQRFAARLEAGETLHLLGLLGTTHNSGVSLIAASQAGGIEILANYEEERFSEVKHFAGYPKRCVAELARLLITRNLAPGDIFGIAKP